MAFIIIRHCAVYCCAVQCCAVTCYAIMCSAVQHIAMQCSTVQQYEVQWCAVKCSECLCPRLHKASSLKAGQTLCGVLSLRSKIQILEAKKCKALLETVSAKTEFGEKCLVFVVHLNISVSVMLGPKSEHAAVPDHSNYRPAALHAMEMMFVWCKAASV